VHNRLQGKLGWVHEEGLPLTELMEGQRQRLSWRQRVQHPTRGNNDAPSNQGAATPCRRIPAEAPIARTKALSEIPVGGIGMQPSESVSLHKNKEDFGNGLAERVKHNKRAATKKFRSPVKARTSVQSHADVPVQEPIPQQSRAMSVDALIPAAVGLPSPLKRRRTLEDVQPPSPKRMRSQSDAQITMSNDSTPTAQPNPLQQRLDATSTAADVCSEQLPSKAENPICALDLDKPSPIVFSPRKEHTSTTPALGSTRHAHPAVRTPEELRPLRTGDEEPSGDLDAPSTTETTQESVDRSVHRIQHHPGLEILRLLQNHDGLSLEPVSNTQVHTDPLNVLANLKEHGSWEVASDVASAIEPSSKDNVKLVQEPNDSEPSTATTGDDAIAPQDVNVVSVPTTQNPESEHERDPIPAAAASLEVVSLTDVPQPPLNADEEFIEQVKEALTAQSKWKTAVVAKRQARRILDLLNVSKAPDTTEASICSNNEAEKHFQTGAYFKGPIFVNDAQPNSLDTVKNFLDEYYDETSKVHIQDPSIRLARNKAHVREVTIKQLRDRFSEPKTKSSIPWNCLELATHVDDGLRPPFLSTEDCRLLTKIKLPSSSDSASRRGYEPGWKEVEKWALLAQAGSLTEPHQDSHGYSTYITVNQGAMGFGWLSNPTPAEKKQWRLAPSTFKGGRWRYQVLRPGRTVFFPTGTVHFVFRLSSADDTLAFGGHVLRCSQIVNWVKCLIDEKANPDITNEDISVSAPAYLDRVARFVKQARRMGQESRWGGPAAITEFLRLKDEFMTGK
jgi:hypothetical protein